MRKKEVLFLHRFIQSLDRGEIRYCVSELARESGNSASLHQAIFEVLRKMPEFDKALFYDSIQDVYTRERISVEKHRLYQLLLKYIGEIRTDRNRSVNLNAIINEAEILLHSGLHADAVDVCKKGILIADKFDDFESEVRLRELLRLSYKSSSRNEVMSDIVSNEYRHDNAVKKLSTFVRYSHINDRLNDYLRHYRTTSSEKILKGVYELENSKELQNILLADSIPSQIRFYSAWSIIYSIKGDSSKAITSIERQLELWELNPDRINRYPQYYRRVISNLLGKLSVSGRVNEVHGYLKKLESIPFNSRRDEISKFCDVELQFCLYYMNTGQLQPALEREKGVNSGLRRFGNLLTSDYTLTFLYNFGVIHLLTDNEKKALTYFERIRRLGVLTVRKDLQVAARLLRLLIICENDLEGKFLGYLRNSKAFFGTSDKGYAIEQLVYEWLRTHQRLVLDRERKDSFGELERLMVETKTSSVVGREEILIWARAKHGGIPLSEVFKESLKHV